ncbi:MAG: Fic family protein [Actinomycetota bacterium]|nr:Fic family protein [Actinomycetota bacterium]
MAVGGDLDTLVSERGETGIDGLRDQARALAPVLGRDSELRRLDELLGAALTTGPVPSLHSERIRARAAGRPFDAARIAAFEALAADLVSRAPETLPAMQADESRRRLLPFYEAYFSNNIEGTEFTLDEAASIVFHRAVPTDRPADAHDILGTYEIVADRFEMRRTPGSAEELEDLLLARHATLMGGRPDELPGRFKERAQLLTAEVHPFTDGNGRLARVMMNAELETAGEVPITIHTVYRNNDLDALRGATHNRHYAALWAMLDFARRWTAQVDFSSRESTEVDLGRTNALRDSTEAEATGLRLLLPASGVRHWQPGVLFDKVEDHAGRPPSRPPPRRHDPD